MKRTRIKICGVCRVEDALAAAEAGADAIGLILHEGSRRYVNAELAKEIVGALPPFVTPVGVFVDAGVEAILAKAELLGLRHVQLNGRETLEDVEKLEGYVVVKAVRVSRETLAGEMEMWKKAKGLKGVVLETAAGNLPGGTGVENDWEAVRAGIVQGEFDGMRVIAAGGLRAETVGEIVRSIRPYAVDVSSGVEETVGEKSARRIREFAAAVREADAFERAIRMRRRG